MTTFRGYKACTCLKKWLKAYEAELLRVGEIKHSLDVYQLIGSYSKSGGTHQPGGAFDVGQYSTRALTIARQMGAATWHRTPPAFIHHAHGVLKGCPHNAGGRYQIAALEAGNNGLGGGGRGGKDDGPRAGIKFPLRTWEQGIAWAKAQVPPKPKKKPAHWFGIDLRNLAGFDKVHGAKTLGARMPELIADIATVGREIVCVLELPNGDVVDFTKRMKAIGYRHVAGDLGRHIYAKATIPTGAAKLFDLKPRLDGDTKQGVAAILYPSGVHPVAVCTAQLENEDASGKTQSGQATNLIDKFEAFCDDHDIAESRRFYALDTNSDNLVRSLFVKHGYVDAFDVAYSSENSTWRSIVRWFGKPAKGKRIDLIAVPKSRPVRRARLRTTTSHLSDHLDQFADIGKI